MLRSRLPEIVKRLPVKTKEGLERGAFKIAADARERVPVGETGNLKRAIHVEPEDGGDGYWVVAGDDEAWYGHIVEHGSVYAAPHPFLVPAFEAERDATLDAVRKGLRTL